MTHPLTDEIIEDILLNRYWWELEPCQDSLRDAADWQLEQVIKWLKDYTETVEFRYHPQYVTTRLKKEMRPQQQENN